MNSIIQRLWDGLPSVQPLVASGAEQDARQGILIPATEAAQLVLCLYKACTANATVEDCKRATAAYTMGTVEKTFSWLESLVQDVVVPEWVDAYFHSSSSSQRPVTPQQANGEDGSVLTPLEEQVKAIVDSVLDDRDPQPLLTFENVLTVPNRPKSLYDPFSTFIALQRYPSFAPVYYRVWNLLIANQHDDAASEVNAAARIDLEQFVRWFTCMYRVQHSNATPARARVAAKSLWFEVLRATLTDTMVMEEFIVAATAFARRYGKVEPQEVEKYLSTVTDFVETLAKSGTQFFDADIPDESGPFPKVTLADANQVHQVDDLVADRCEEEYFRRPTSNRTLIVGHNGLPQKGAVSQALAASLNCVYVDIFGGAVAAVDAAAAAAGDDALSEVGRQILECVETGAAVSLEARAQLVRSIITTPSTVHRGYVFDDMPYVNPALLSSYLEQCGFSTVSGALPQNIVTLLCPASIAARIVEQSIQDINAKRDLELSMRQEEQRAADEKAAAKALREEKRAARAARADRKARIEAGELQPADDEAPENAVDEGEPEDLEEPAELDEEGNPMEPDAVVQRDEVRAKERRRRILLEDIRHALATDIHGAAVEVSSIASLEAVYEKCQRARRVAEISSSSKTADAVEFISTYFSLAPSTVPVEIPLPEDAPENPDGSADNDIGIADAKLRAVTESGRETLSKWRRLCPVTYAEHRVLLEGSMAYSVTYRGRYYCFTSPAYMRRFIASPHEYLLQSVTGVAPLLVVKRTLDVFQKSALTADAVETGLAKTLGLTVAPLEAFAATWGQQRALEGARLQSQTTRAAADAKQRVGREERLKKRLEAEAKKKKKDGDKKKPAKKKDDEAAGDGTEGDVLVEGADAAQEVVIVETTADRSAKAISAEKTRLQSFCPLLVTTLAAMNEDLFTTLFDDRVLPPTVIVLDYEEPKPEADEDAAPEEEGDEEPEEAEVPEELDEDGNPKPRPPKPPKIFDPTDDKQYRRLMKKLLGKMAMSTESSGTEPEAGEEGKPAPKPYQAFNTITVNVFNKRINELIGDIVLAVHPLAVNAQPPQDGEDITADPEAEEGDLRNPLLIPGARADHQFGTTLKYCPVALRDKGVLMIGDPANWLSYKGKKYMFSTPEALALFKQHPPTYADDVKVSVAPRVWIVGVPFAGRRTLATRLSAAYGVPLFSMEDANLDTLLEATNSAEGATVGGIFVPSSNGANAFAQRAAALAHELKSFDKDQADRQALKDKTQEEQNDREQRRENGDDVDELDEEEEAEIQKALEFEPEEPEAREERVSKARRQIAAALTRIEPFESQGYLLVGRPNNETEMQLLLDEGAFPDVVVNLKISSETSVARQIEAEFATRKALQDAKQQEVDAKRRAIMIKARESELRKWRRRNIGAEDAADEEEAEEAPEDVEPVTMDAVRGEIEAQYETDNGNVGGVVAGLPDRRVPLVELNGDVGVEQVFMHAVENLARIFLPARRSLFYSVQVCTYDEARGLATSGLKMLSSFGFVDPTIVAAERKSRHESLRMKVPGCVVTGEDEIPDVPPPAPKEKKFRTVTKTNEDGEEIEVQEEDPEEEEAPPEEVEAEEPPEPEPELSPEELDEMRKEHEDRVQAAANKKKRKAAILGHRVYFFDNDATLLQFVQDPLKYWDQAPPYPIISAPIVAVMEAAPPLHGDVKPRSMAEHLANNTGSVYINAPKLLQWALLNVSSLGPLSEEARRALVTGQPASDAAMCELLHCRLTCADVQMRGAVLNNLPRTVTQVNSLMDGGLRISKCFTFGEDAPILRSVVDAIYARTRVMEAITEEPYTMASLRQMVQSVRLCELKQRKLVLSKELGFPSPTVYTPLLETVLAANRSQYKSYCPYMWCRHQQLVEDPSNRKLVAEYLGKYFCFSSLEFFKEFLQHPEIVSGESLAYGCGEAQTATLELPSVLPTHLTQEDATSINGTISLELAGCCPVVLYDTRMNVGLRGVTEPTAVPGDAERFLVKYDGKYYAIKNQEHTERFLRQPWVFAKFAVLPAAEKLPFDRSTLKGISNELYAGRTMREAAARAMLAVCRERPKYPGLTLEESALKFMALYIKAHNDANSEIASQQYQHNYSQFATEATLYKTIKTEAPDDAEGQREFHVLCNSWDRVQDEPQGYRAYIHLQQDHAASQ
jgi:YHS domain-containing protein